MLLETDPAKTFSSMMCFQTAEISPPLRTIDRLDRNSCRRLNSVARVGEENAESGRHQNDSVAAGEAGQIADIRRRR